MTTTGRHGRGDPKVLLVTPRFFSPHSTLGGGERYVLNLFKALRAVRPAMETRILTFDRVARDKAGGDDGTMICLLDESPRSPVPAGQNREFWSAVDWADLVHVCQPFSPVGALACVIAASLGKRIVVTDLGSGRRQDYLEILSLVHGVVAISDFSARLWVGTTQPVTVIKGPVDDSFFVPAADAVPSPQVVCVARWLPHKGQDMLIQALPESLRLVLVGSTFNPDYVEYLRALSEGKDVVFVEDASDDEVREIYRRSLACVLPSRHVDSSGAFHVKAELLGLAPLEALCCGVPAIVARTGALPELVEPQTGAVFDSPGELEILLKDVRDNRWPANCDATAIRNIASARFGLMASGRALCTAYDGAMATR